jgi:23S rRNA (guanosine2251-2'-O)-methyltransferase
VVGLAGEAQHDLRTLSLTGAGRVLVIGSEGYGLRRLVRERCTVLAKIAMAGPIESLNASVAAGIALYALSGS